VFSWEWFLVFSVQLGVVSWEFVLVFSGQLGVGSWELGVFSWEDLGKKEEILKQVQEDRFS